MEVGAGTLHTATTLKSIGTKPLRADYVQPSRRPSDGRDGVKSKKLKHNYQFQVLIKPSPKNIKKLYLNSLSVTGIKHSEHDIRLVEDDWESPTLGAAGMGWEVWCDGMAICLLYTAAAADELLSVALCGRSANKKKTNTRELDRVRL